MKAFLAALFFGAIGVFFCLDDGSINLERFPN